jgi:hypothetical protein
MECGKAHFICLVFFLKAGVSLKFRRKKMATAPEVLHSEDVTFMLFMSMRHIYLGDLEKLSLNSNAFDTLLRGPGFKSFLAN